MSDSGATPANEKALDDFRQEWKHEVQGRYAQPASRLSVFV